MTNTMIQRLAHTMLLADAEGVKLWKTEDGLQGYAWDFEAAQEMVKRVLTAMREPTEAMQAAAFREKVFFRSTSGMSDIGQVSVEYPGDREKGAATLFRAMIDTALAEGQ
jgi:hypothetical protein